MQKTTRNSHFFKSIVLSEGRREEKLHSFPEGRRHEKYASPADVIPRKIFNQFSEGCRHEKTDYLYILPRSYLF